jgi:microcystin-dependent protein
MGGTSANRLTGLSGGVDGDILGGSGGSETHTLTTAQLAVHSHTYSLVSSTTGGTDPASGTRNNTTPNTGNAGSGSAHNNVQPTLILTYIIKT